MRLRRLIWVLVVGFAGSLPAEDMEDVLVSPGLEMNLPAGRTVVWTAVFPTCWWKLVESLKLQSIDLNPPSIWGQRLNALHLDSDKVLPTNAWYAAAGLASKELQASIQTEMVARMGGRMPGLDLEWRDLIPGSVVACCWLKQKLDFEPKFYRAKATPMSFTMATGGKIDIEYFGTTSGLASRFSDVVKILEHDGDGTVLQLQPGQKGERLLLGKRLRKPDGRPVSLLSDAVDRMREQRAAYERILAADDETKLGAFGWGDVLKVPVVSFEASANYTKALAGSFAAPGYRQPMRFVQAWQIVNFDLDETGARIEAAASGAAEPFGGPPPKPPEPRLFVFDEPFFIAAWRDGAPLPYFVAHIDGSSVLRKWETAPKR